MYWDNVLQEVLNKEKPFYRFYFTSVREGSLSGYNLVREERSALRPPREIKKFFLAPDFPEIYFTEREAQTLLHFARKRNTGVVAKMMGLSPRTIEFYFKNIKSKLQCRSKAELLEKVAVGSWFEQLEGKVGKMSPPAGYFPSP